MPRSSTSGQGRKKGVPNKLTGDIKAMIVGALNDVGGREWLAGQAEANPVAFMGLVGKVLPLQVTGENGAPMAIDFRWADAQPTEPEVVDVTGTATLITFATPDDAA